jgi:probable selenium-dependent hydroxylase accessory protein YqeC
MDLAGTLGLDDHELVSFVGAGGKKTAMARLVEEGADRGRAVGYTTTAHVPPPEYPLVLAEPDSVLDALAQPVAAEDATGNTGGIAFARERVEDPDRVDVKLRGFPPAVVDEVFDAARFDWLVVKADGARMRDLKAPGADEPPVPSRSSVVVPVASVRAVGASLTAETVHRPERVAAVTGRSLGETLEPADLGRLLASPEGGVKHVPAESTVVPMLNKADTERLQARAGAVLAAAFARTDRFDRGLVTSFLEDHCEVVRSSDVS